MLGQKQFKDVAFTGSNWCLSKSIKKKLDEQMVVFILTVDHNKYKKESTILITNR